MGDVPILLVLLALFVVSVSGTFLTLRIFRSKPCEGSGDSTREAEALRHRAEANVEGAEEVVARAKRLEKLVALRKQDHG